MNDDEINEKYNQLLNKHGLSFKSLGWSKDLNNSRFYNVLKNLPLLSEDRVLDFGCGFGDLYGYLKDQNVTSDYVGIDINDNLLKVAKQRYPNAYFEKCNILDNGYEGRAVDYVVSCGVHNIKKRDNYQFLELSLDRFSSLAKKGISINFLSDKVEYFTKDSFHFDPSRALDMAYKYSNRVVLDNSVMPFEYSLTILFDQKFEKGYPVYSNMRD